MVDKPLQGVADRATDSDAFEYAARAGFAVSGLLHLLIAYIILRIAFGSGGNADQSGALATLAGQTGGTVILWVAAVGLVALGLWRIAEAIVGSKPGEGSGQRHDDTPAWKRAKSIGLAIVNFAIALSAARFAMGSGQQSSQQNAGLSAQMMQSGWGKALLIVVALGLVAVGGYHVYKGAVQEVPERLARLRRNRNHGGRHHRLRRQGRSARRRGCARHRRDAAGRSRRRRPGSMPRSRHSVMPRSARFYSSWPPLVSPPSARTASCAVATAACRPLYRRARLGQRLVQRGDLHRLDCGAAAALHVDQRSCDAAQLLIVLRMGDEVIRTDASAPAPCIPAAVSTSLASGCVSSHPPAAKRAPRWPYGKSHSPYSRAVRPPTESRSSRRQRLQARKWQRRRTGRGARQ